MLASVLTVRRMEPFVGRAAASCSFPVLFASFMAFAFIIADLCFYGVLSTPPCRGSNCSLSQPSVKLMMQDHMGHYVHHYGAEWFEHRTKISELPFITPNLITFTHLCLAFVSGYFVSSEQLMWRRFGVFLFQARFFLDMLDGAVFRAQQHKKMVVNGWGTWGYVIDASADVLAGLVLCSGLFVYLRRCPPRDVASKAGEKSARAALNNEPFSAEKVVNRSAINVTLGLVLLQGLLRSMFWDRYQFQLFGLLQTKFTKPTDVVSCQSMVACPDIEWEHLLLVTCMHGLCTAVCTLKIF